MSKHPGGKLDGTITHSCHCVDDESEPRAFEETGMRGIVARGYLTSVKEFGDRWRLAQARGVGNLSKIPTPQKLSY